MRAKGTTWRIDPEHGWTCALCQGFIPAGEPFRASAPENHTAAVCMSCIVSAVGPVLAGKPENVVVEQASWMRDSPGHLFDLWVDGEEVGTLTVEAEIPEEQRVPALLALVCNALRARRDRKGLPAAKHPELGVPAPMIPAATLAAIETSKLGGRSLYLTALRAAGLIAGTEEAEGPSAMLKTYFEDLFARHLAEQGQEPTKLVTLRKENCSPLLVPADRIEDFAEAGWFPEELLDADPPAEVEP